MLENWLKDVDLTPFLLIFAIALLPIQLALCFKVKSKIVRLLPVTLFSLATAALAVMIAISEGWDVIGYLLLFIFAALMLFMCCFGWVIWGVIWALKKRKYSVKD